MESSGINELVITNDALKYAKIIAAPIDNEFQRKRAFASIVALDAFADYLVTQDINVSITKNLFKIAPVNEEFEISDLYYNGWKLDVRLVVNDEFISIPKSHFKFDILADMYVAIKVDSNLENAELVGFIEGNKVSKTIDSGAYYLMNVGNLSPVDEMIAKLQTPKKITSTSIDHSAFKELYLAYLDNDIDNVGKKSFIKHVSACAECRGDFVEFYDFEAIVKNSALNPEIFEDHTLSIVGGQAIEQEQYFGKEEQIIICDPVETDKIDKTKNAKNSDEGDILGGLFENPSNNLLTENKNNGLLNAGVVAVGALGAGAIIAGAASASASTTGAVAAGAAIVGAGADLISSSVKSLSKDVSSADLTSDALKNATEEGVDLDFLNELAEISKRDEDGDFSLFDEEAVDLFSENIDAQIKDIDTSFESFEAFKEDDELIAPIEEIDGDVLQDDMLVLDTDESINFDETVEEDFLLEDEEKEPLDCVLEENNSMDLLSLDSDEEPINDFMSEDTLIVENDSIQDNMLDESLMTSSLELEDSNDDGDNFMSFSKQDDDFILEEKDYSFEPHEQALTEEEQLDEFKDFINAGNEMKEDEEGDSESLDNEIQLSYSSENEDGEIDPEGEEIQFSYPSEDDEIESTDGGFLESNAQASFENDAEQGEMRISDSSKDDDQELKVLYENQTDADDEAGEVNEQIEYLMNKPDGLALFKDKKVVILSSCVVACLLFGTVFGIFNYKNKIARENAELANQQLSGQMDENSQNMGSLTPIPMGDATTGEELAKGSTANIPKDMDKVMTNVFDENPSTVAVTKISWEVSQSIASNELFNKYLQIAGKNLQLNLKNDLINATEFSYNDKVKVLIIIGKDNNVKKIEVLNTSGSQQIDDIVLQSIKETLKYINVPQLPDSAVPSQHNLAKDNAYNLKLVINF